MEGKYYIASNGETPEAMYFEADDAFASGFEYLYVFDEEGTEVITYKLKAILDYNVDTTEDDYTAIF